MELSCSEVTPLADPGTAAGQPWGRAAAQQHWWSSCGWFYPSPGKIFLIPAVCRENSDWTGELPADPKQLHGDVEVGRERWVGEI